MQLTILKKIVEKNSDFLIPNGWNSITLEDKNYIKKIRAGGTPKSTINEYYNGDIPYVKIEDMTSFNKYLTSTNVKISKLGLENSNAWIVPANSILYSMYASYGECVINKIPVATNQAIIALIPSEHVDLDYLYYSLQNMKSKLKKHTQETTQKNLNAEIVKNFEILLPPMPEQRKIAAILSTVDASIEETENIISMAKQLKNGLIQIFFSNFSNNTINNGNNYRIDSTEIEWAELSLADISLSYKNGIYKEPHYYGTGYPSIRMYNIVNGLVNKINAPLLEVTKEELETYSLKRGDLLINRVNSSDLVGKAGIVQEDLGSITFESKNIRVRLNEKMVLPEYMSIFVQSNAYMRQIRMMVKSAIAQSTINQDDLNRLVIPLPSLEEQQKIVNMVKSIDRKLLIEINNRNHLEQLKKGLMQVLLTGKVRVKVGS